MMQEEKKESENTHDKKEVTKTAKGGFWLVVALGIIAVTVVLFLILRGVDTQPSAEEVATEFIYSIRDGNYDGAYALTSGEFQSTVQVGDLEKFSETHKVLYENVFLEFNKEMVETEQTILVGVIKDPEGVDAPVILYLEQVEDAGWRIKFFSINPADIPVELVLPPVTADSEFDGEFEIDVETDDEMGAGDPSEDESEASDDENEDQE